MSLTILSNEVAVPAMGSATTLPDELAELVAENTALKQEICRLSAYRTLAYRDALTGLNNRRAFTDRLAEECARTSRRAGYTFSVVLVDLDEFKTINDTLGHAEGDRVLVAVARYLERNTRSVDVCCRIGGDEFAVILPDTDEVGRQIVVDRLQHAVRPAIDGKTERIGMSVGVATCPPEIPDADRVVAAADEAMYRDKERRRALRRTA